MFRLSSWISESRAEKVVDGESDPEMADAMNPGVNILPTGGPKRKRDPSEDAPDVTIGECHEPKRRKADESEGTSGSKGHTRAEVSSKKELNSRLYMDAVESQLNLEILLKHDEKRLIDQELAKCQVALEQLRRCHLIPYPVSQGTPESMLNVTNGTGPARGQGGNVPRWAPPYGVTNGPYSRHYSRWLIPDQSFDGVQAERERGLESTRSGKTVLEGRTTRNSVVDGSTSAGKSRSQRGSAGQKLQALSSGYSQPKEKAGPCTLKRGDGQLVKLVCIDCHRDNFSSTQGFINHCRIAHHRDFKSHEEAAVACGQPIELDEVGGIIGADRTPPRATGLVHPLILSTPSDHESYVSLISSIQSRIDDSVRLWEAGRLPGITSIPTSATSTPQSGPILAESTQRPNFVPSNVTPHLSELMRRRGFNGDLNEIVDEAKIVVDFEDDKRDETHGEDSEEGERPTDRPQRPIGGLDGADSPPAMRTPARAVVSIPFSRPTSSKGINNVSVSRKSGTSPRLSYASIDTATASQHNKPSSRLIHSHHAIVDEHDRPDIDTEMLDGPSIVDLSPNTVASNNAPSLVSDDGEYDEGDDAESSATSADEDEGSDIAEIIEDGDGVDKVTVAARTVLRTRNGNSLKKDDKHVAFVTPVKETTGKGRRNRK
ncbi:hypothetical protein B7494_g1480 [Chlorociboria aeruginascens]|nr:hypothetical protein B7494_g1480 [Chlorociboria aeruginascens]